MSELKLIGFLYEDAAGEFEARYEHLPQLGYAARWRIRITDRFGYHTVDVETHGSSVNDAVTLARSRVLKAREATIAFELNRQPRGLLRTRTLKGAMPPRFPSETDWEALESWCKRNGYDGTPSEMRPREWDDLLRGFNEGKSNRRGARLFFLARPIECLNH